MHFLACTSVNMQCPRLSDLMLFSNQIWFLLKIFEQIELPTTFLYSTQRPCSEWCTKRCHRQLDISFASKTFAKTYAHKEGEQMHNHVIKLGFLLDIFVSNSKGRPGAVVRAVSLSHQVVGSKQPLRRFCGGKACLGFFLPQTPLMWEPPALGLPPLYLCFQFADSSICCLWWSGLCKICL